jgi:putative iron-dependent peroxidase
MSASQSGILAPVTQAAHYVTLALAPDADPRAIIARLRTLQVDDALVVGVGAPLAGAQIQGLDTFAAFSGPGVAVPSTQAALWLQGRGKDAGASLHAIRRAIAALGEGLRIEEDVVAYKYDIGRDLSGFEDGTENPKGEKASAAAICPDGSSFVATQRWVHDLARLETLDGPRLVGRARDSNEELADAPETAHIKRSQQEAFDPPAFMVRRSMPYGGVREHGLYFVAYVSALATFERMMRRMAGCDDGMVDALFQFSHPVSGGYYWCPPRAGDRLDLAKLAAITP